MRDDFALARVRGAVTGSEQATRDGDKCVVEVALKRTVPMCVNDLHCSGICDG